MVSVRCSSRWITFAVLFVQFADVFTAKCTSSQKCINIRSCPPLVTLLQKRPLDPADTEFLRNSQCGFDGIDPLVCCDLQDQGTKKPSGDTGTPITSRHPNGITSNLLPRANECGIDTSDKIVGGEVTDINEFPWMALLEYRTPKGRGFYCGGVLISSRYVLTAAHCIKGKDLPSSWSLVSVRLGEYDLDTSEDCVSTGAGKQECADPPVDIPIDDKLAHESYNPFDRNQYHDIGLLRLSRPAPFSEYIKPICLPTSIEHLSKDFIGTKPVIAGWGKTENTSQSNIKLKVQVPVKSLDDCRDKYSRAGVQLANSQMCAGGVKGQDTCRGDSGGPMMTAASTRTDSIWLCIGIVSFGPSPCGMAGWPAIYTRVTEYVDWIVNTMRP